MAWYWILAIIVGYPLIGGIIVGIIDCTEGIDENEAIAYVIAWPVMVSGLLGYFIASCCFDFIDKIKKY